MASRKGAAQAAPLFREEDVKDVSLFEFGTTWGNGDRGVVLLYNHLTRAQRYELWRFRCLTIYSKSGTAYRIDATARPSVLYQILDRLYGQPPYECWRSFCVGPFQQAVTLCDLILSHKLLLETDARDWRRHAHMQ